MVGLQRKGNKMVTCQEFLANIGAVANSQMSMEDLQEFEEHAEECEACNEALFKFIKENGFRAA